MVSKITIEVDFDNQNLPVIQIIQKDSDDVRDKLIRNFLQSLQHTSRWAVISYEGAREIIGDSTYGEVWKIYPITPQKLPQEMELMQTIIDGYQIGDPVTAK